MFVGFEIEFNLMKGNEVYMNRTLRNYLIGKLNEKFNVDKVQFVTEFYDSMIEINGLYPLVNASKIEEIFKWIESESKNVGFACKVEYKSRIVTEPTYNGLHVHTMCIPHIFERDLPLVLKNIDSSQRFITSHHIWGGCGFPKDRWSSYQVKSRYIPLNYNVKGGKFDTFEIRAFNCNNLKDDFAMIDAIYKAINCFDVNEKYIALDFDFFTKLRDSKKPLNDYEIAKIFSTKKICKSNCENCTIDFCEFNVNSGGCDNKCHKCSKTGCDYRTDNPIDECIKNCVKCKKSDCIFDERRYINE